LNCRVKNGKKHLTGEVAKTPDDDICSTNRLKKKVIFATIPQVSNVNGFFFLKKMSLF
jgi:hypothetical protein